MTSIEAADPERTGAAPCAADGTPVNTCFARQPILDRDGMLCGYELKVHCFDASPAAAGEDEDEGKGEGADAASHADPATDVGPYAPAPVTLAQSLARSLALHGVRGALAGHPGYLDVSREMLLDDALELIAAERFMFEIPPDMEVDDALVARIVTLHARRYRFVLDGVVVPNDTFARLLPYAEGVKIDLPQISRVLLPKLASVLKSAGKLLIASGVDTQEDLETAHDLGFDKFQGYFFARAQTASLRRVSAPRHALLNLLQLLAGDPTVAQLEAELKLNPVLVMHLMKLANSSGLAVGHKVTTLREAINATGTNRIARWTQLLLYADGRKVALEDDPLLQLAATRARFMELAVLRLPEAGRDEADAAFLTGVFSFVDAVFGGSLENTLDVLTLSKPIQDAILHREGVLGLLLSAVEALERGAWAEIEAACERLVPLTVSEVAELGLTAAAWAGVADRSAEARGLERIED
ncbi:MAG TPA: EAL domain-containing protein [Paraburkholderia sp.]|jgi:c-di-GMP-related signal transduction protein|nr:EAL domain-containing protein [Paraburkholderia sp.]